MASDFETLTDVVREQVADPTIAWGVFRVAESLKDSPRRVVWVPTVFDCEPVEVANPIRNYDTHELEDILLTDRVVVECHIYGIDFEDAIAIRRKVLNATRTAFGNSSTPTRGAYQTELEGHSGYMWGGASKIIQEFHWMINVAKPDTTTVVVESIELTAALQPGDPPGTEETLTIPPAP